MGCEKVFIRQLRERGFRLTPQREMVLSVLHDVEGFATAEEIYGRVRDLSSSVDLSTVYRTLDLLEEFNLVACVDPGNGQRRYELLGLHGPHLHLVCQSCGEVAGIDPAPAQSLAEQLREQYGFVMDVDHLSLPGWCRTCAETEGAAVWTTATSHGD
jgi:Fur family ferric uptake transcriptional regulator